VGVGGLQSPLELVEDEPELVYLVTAVEALPTRATRWDNLVVALFPAAKRLCGHPEHLDDGADAVYAVLFCGVHAH
jgi:hypothetical protein